MAITYKEEALPAVSTFAFDINRWAGVNKIKGSQYDYEMADCKNMSSDNFPYASPRKPREKLIDEAGIKRIYKVEDGKIYYIDKDDYLCYTEKGVKSYVTYTDENDAEQKIQIKDCECTNIYDSFSVFYPYLLYINEKNEPNCIKYPLFFGNRADYVTIKPTDEFGDELSEYMPDDNMYQATYESTVFDVDNFDVKEIAVKITLPEAKEYELPEATDARGMRFVLRIYDKDGNTKKYTDESGAEHLITSVKVTVTGRENVFTINIPNDITLEQGDYCLLRIGYFGDYGAYQTEWQKNLDYIMRGEFEIETSAYGGIITGPVLDYGVVYNNRIVGVRKNRICASALGDFSNFWEYADEAGNPSATGAYATDVGSAGDFTGICAYNNVLLLFKKDIVYEMYGSMPYTITELCTTGCIDNDSIASIDGVLYWASPKGIVRYSGGVPNVISTQIDIKTDGICKAGTDGRKYYVYDGYKTYVYDTYYQMWHIEDETSIKMRYSHINDLYTVCEDGIYKANSGKESMKWEFTTKDYTFSSKERKNLSKLWIRADMQRNSRLEIYVRQNGGEWSRVAVKTAENDEMFDFKLRVKKCDSYTIKFKGKGDVRILDIHGKVTVGTSKHRSGNSLNVYRK